MERSFGIALSIWAFCLPTLAEDDLHGRHECADARIEAYQRISTQTGLREPQTLGPGGGGIVTGFAEDTDVLHYKLELEVQPSQRWIGGTNAMTVASLVDDLTLFRFRLSDVLEISEVKVGDVAVTWTQIDRETVEVQLDRSYARNEQFVLFVAYSGKPVSDGFGSIEFNGSTQAWTLSETWFAYTWVPLKDELTDKATAELAFIVPKSLIAASNGLLVGTDDLEGDRKRYRWETEYQTATYLFSFSIGNFKTYEKTWTYGELAMPVQFFIYPQNDSQNNRNAWFRVPDMLTVFSDVYGVYPFAREKYGIANFGWGGGMEHQTCTSQGGFSEYLNAHELAHQWWGDNVTCETWHDIWLNEGFATYSEAIWIENEPGKGGKQALINAMLNRKPGSVGDSVYVYDDANFDRIFSYNYTYLKGGWVLHMLRHVVGDERFFQILREYRAAYEGDVATTADFQAAAEAVYGESLAWFFEQWVYDIGAPIYRYASRKSQAGGRDYLEMYIEQGQREDWPVFRMPIDIAATIDGETTVYPVWNVVRKQHYVIPVSGPVDTVAFDPESWILVSAASGRSFVEGPPKIVTLFPGIDDARRSAEVTAVTIGFHKNVFVAPQDFELTDPNGEAVEFDLTYDATNFVATLTLKDELGLGRYSLRIADSVKERTKQIALDGEIPGGQITGLPLPSGDGVAGGAALIEFDIVPPLGDLNCDGSADFADIDPFVAAVVDRAAYEQSYPACDWSLADLNGDGGVDFNDIDPFVELLTK